MVGTLVWAVIVGSLGYSFGYALEAMLGNLKRYELLVFGVLAGIGMAFWLGRSIAGKE